MGLFPPFLLNLHRTSFQPGIFRESSILSKLYQKYEIVKGKLDIIRYILESVDSTLNNSNMEDKSSNLRKILAINIKKHREKLGITQENLAEKADISAAMMNDIEGCRTWVSDKTLKNLSSALKVDTYRLFIPETTSGEAIPAEVVMELTFDLQEMLRAYTANVEKTLKKRGFLFDKAICGGVLSDN
jgi:transcriptional regulator with XRE-family HTH domain